jgi:ribosome-associated protein
VNKTINTTEEPTDLGDLDDERWVRAALDAADEKLGSNSRAFFVGEAIAITDWFAVTSANNSRQVRAIVDEIEEQLRIQGGPKPRRIEGKDTLSWVLMDYGSFVVHVFDAESREYYDLERLWRDMPELQR